MFKFILCRYDDNAILEMQKLMTERKDYNSMRLPRSFANIQKQIFSEKNEFKLANKPFQRTAKRRR